MSDTAHVASAPAARTGQTDDGTVADVPGGTHSHQESLVARSVRRLVVVLVAIAALVGSVSPAGATLISPSGAIGPSAVGQGKCEYLPVWGDLRISAAAPTIYARNYRAGGGNDWQYVRIAAALINTSTGTVVQQTGFSQATVAWDNVPARFSGQSSFRAGWRGNYRVMFTIEWLDGSARTVLGRAYQRVDSYLYYSNGVGPFSPVSSCAKGL